MEKFSNYVGSRCGAELICLYKEFIIIFVVLTLNCRDASFQEISRFQEMLQEFFDFRKFCPAQKGRIFFFSRKC